MSAQVPIVAGVFVISDGLAVVGEHYMRCRSVKTAYALNQVPIAEIIVVADDTKAEAGTAVISAPPVDLPATTKEIYDILLSVKKGDDVSVEFKISSTIVEGKELSQEPVTAFTGVILGWAPVWIGPKLMEVKIWAIHSLGMLDWAPATLDNVHGSGMDDYSLPAVTSAQGDLVPYMQGEYDPVDVAKDIWKNLIKPELINLCTMNRFGSTNAAKAAEYLNDAEMDLSESPLSWQLSDITSVILDVRKTLLQAGAGRHTIWDNFVVLANKYKFSILCRPAGFNVEPILPALGGDPVEYYALNQQSFLRREEFNSMATEITQAVGSLRGIGGISSFYDVEGRRIQQEFRNPVGNTVVAGVDYSMIPAFLDFRYDAFLKTGGTMGLKDERLYASGYCLEGPADAVSTLNEGYNGLPKADISSYVDVVMNDRSYDGTTAILQGNVDFNVGPGNTVRAEIPLYNTTGDVTFPDPRGYYCGLVHCVMLVLDPVARTTGTYVVLSHVRSYDEQKAIELQRHPLYDKRWISAPLISIPDYTLEPQNA